MREFTYTISDENGLHARPAGLLVKTASEYSSKITLTANAKVADGKKIFSVMQLCARCGDTVKVTVEGKDEENATTRLEKFFADNL